MLIHSAAQLVTLAGGPRRGADMNRLEIIPDGAVLMEAGRIAAVGESAVLLARYPRAERLDARGRVVMPGLVDPHTHLVWAGDRAAEFEMRLQGKSYMEIMAAGGGIAATVRATRQASREDLLAQTRQRARRMLAHGTTTVEAKTGYGLDLASELAQLEVLLALDEEGPLEIAPTFMGAHAVAPEFNGDAQAYTDHICAVMLPAVRDWWQQNAAARPLPFVDVFSEKGVFDLEQTRQILLAAHGLGFPLKLHVDEFENIGAASLAAELGAVSADHLVKTSPRDIEALARSDTVAVSLPCTPFGLGQHEYTPARQIIAAGGLLALATDLNPGPAWCENMQFVLALACRAMRLTPAEALCAATINAAAAVRRDGLVGSLEAGKQADALVLQSGDFRDLAYRFGVNQVQTVIKKGEVIYNAPATL
ncbi:MAG: imidazolonepropionase [Chloroflexi bacterium]|nr:imidazolonepropionase [Chloroflexota bacterium]